MLRRKSRFPSFKPWIAGFFVILLGIGLCAKILNRRGKVSVKSFPSLPSKDEAELMQLDMKIIANPSASVESINESLNRLAQRREPKALGKIASRVASPDMSVRKITAQQLGFFADSKTANSLLVRLLSDSEETVRTAALTALDTHWTSERKGILINHFQRNTSLAAPERAQIVQVLARRVANPVELNRWAKAMSELLGQVKSLEVGANLVELLVRAPDHNKYLPELMQATTSILKSKGEAAATDASKIKILGTLSRLCPSNRYELMSQVVATASIPVVRRLLMELPHHGTVGERVFREIEQSKFLYDALKSAKPPVPFKALEAAFKSPNRRDPCAAPIPQKR